MNQGCSTRCSNQESPRETFIAIPLFQSTLSLSYLWVLDHGAFLARVTQDSPWSETFYRNTSSQEWYPLARLSDPNLLQNLAPARHIWSSWKMGVYLIRAAIPSARECAAISCLPSPSPTSNVVARRRGRMKTG